jgi:hypothetical protein
MPGSQLQNYPFTSYCRRRRYDWIDDAEEDSMAKQLDPEQFEDVKEMMIYEVVLSEALVNLLDKKGLIKKAEILAEIKKIKAKTIEKKK